MQKLHSRRPGQPVVGYTQPQQTESTSGPNRQVTINLESQQLLSRCGYQPVQQPLDRSSNVVCPGASSDKDSLRKAYDDLRNSPIEAHKNIAAVILGFDSSANKRASAIPYNAMDFAASYAKTYAHVYAKRQCCPEANFPGKNEMAYTIDDFLTAYNGEGRLRNYLKPVEGEPQPGHVIIHWRTKEDIKVGVLIEKVGNNIKVWEHPEMPDYELTSSDYKILTPWKSL